MPQWWVNHPWKVGPVVVPRLDWDAKKPCMFDLVDPDCCGPGCQHSCHQLIWDADLRMVPARLGVTIGLYNIAVA